MGNIFNWLQKKKNPGFTQLVAGGKKIIKDHEFNHSDSGKKNINNWLLIKKC